MVHYRESRLYTFCGRSTVSLWENYQVKITNRKDRITCPICQEGFRVKALEKDRARQAKLEEKWRGTSFAAV